MQKYNEGALSDLRVIEMGQLLAGPFCGQLLGDFGAEVIKVEPPEIGDPMRQWGREKPHGKSLWWPVIARNKKSITVNLRVEKGQQIIKDLVQSTDILIENFRPGTLERWNMSYETLSEINPRLIMVRVSGYGQTGPYSKRAGFGAIGEAMGGLRYVSGDPSTQPSRVGISIGDELAAMHACMGALMAIHARERTGKGQVVDSAIYESVLNMMESLVTEYNVAGYTRERTGPIIPNVAPSNIFETKDNQMILIGANQDGVFSRLCKIMDQPELSSNEKYSTHSARGKNQKELDDLIDLAVNYYKEKIEPQKKYRLPNEKERKGITELINTLSTLNNETSSDDIQAIVFAIGKKLQYENLREWFKGLYETVLGQSEGPRMGSFIKLYGIEQTKKLLEDVILGNLVKE